MWDWGEWRVWGIQVVHRWVPLGCSCFFPGWCFQHGWITVPCGGFVSRSGIAYPGVAEHVAGKEGDVLLGSHWSNLFDFILIC
jgi:hypothetical protein